MATKNWKKSQTSSGYYKRYSENSYDRIKFVKLTNGWKVNLYPRNFGGVKGIPTDATRFKTKASALAFARRYMRTH